jgi:hypothetical protein
MRIGVGRSAHQRIPPNFLLSVDARKMMLNILPIISKAAQKRESHYLIMHNIIEENNSKDLLKLKTHNVMLISDQSHH